MFFSYFSKLFLCKKNKKVGFKNKEMSNFLVENGKNGVRKNCRECTILETGAILEKDWTFYNSFSNLTLPYFCMVELKKLANVNNNASIAIENIHNSSVNIVSTAGKEELNYYWWGLKKVRSKGVVALALVMVNQGFEVTIITHSSEISILARLQKVPFKIVRV